jgi:hypothetical protein
MSALDEAYDACVRDTQSYYAEVMNAELIVALVDSPGQRGEDLRLHEQQSVQALVIAHQGDDCIPVFDSLERFQQWVGPRASYAVTTGLALLQAVRGATPLALNPGTNYQRIFSREEIRQLQSFLRERSAAKASPDGPPLWIGAPEKSQEALHRQMRLWLSRYPEVVAAYLATYRRSLKGEAHPILMVRTENGGRDLYLAVFKGADGEIQAKLGPDAILKAYDSDPLDAQIEMAVAPFYTRICR